MAEPRWLRYSCIATAVVFAVDALRLVLGGHVSRATVILGFVVAALAYLYLGFQDA